MTALTIDNLNDTCELDVAAKKDVSGGFVPGLDLNALMGAHLVMASIDTTMLSANATNINLISGAGGTNAVGSLSSFNVNTGNLTSVSS